MGLRVSFDHVQSRALKLIQPGTTAVFPWGRGSGKSYFDRTVLLKLALENAGIEIGLLLPTLKRAKQIFWPQLFNVFHGDLKREVKKLDATLLEVNFRNGSRLTTWGAENADGIRGQRFGAIVQDETDEIDASVEHAVVEPTFSKAGASAIWVKTGTPKRGRLGILYRDHVRAQQGYSDGARTYAGFRVRSADSPQVDQAWLKSVKATTPPKIYAREYDCDFDAAEGLVFGDVFDASFHVREPPELDFFSEFVCGVDHGWADPGVLLLGGIRGNGEDAELWLLDEHYKTATPTAHWDALAKQWDTLRGIKVQFWADRSRPDRIDALRHQGLAVQPGDSDPNAIQAGVGRIADLLFIRQHEEVGPKFLNLTSRRARLYVSPKCVNTIREFGSYRRKKDSRSADEDPVFLDEFQPGNDHAMDALRYMALGRFGRMPNQRTIVSGR